MLKIIILSCLYFHLSLVAADADPVLGKNKAVICIGCHGSDGNNNNTSYPILAGQSEAYLTKQLNDFKSGKRKEEHMSSMVDAITKSDIPSIALYFSIQKRKKLKTTKNDHTNGKQIYNKGVKSQSIPACIQCHVKIEKGKNVTLIPTLAGQHSDYIQKALKEFRSGKRANDSNRKMRNIAAKLTDAQIQAIADYVRTMRLK